MLNAIVLLTDFGLADPYVGQMKGAILCLAPAVPCVDLCHNVQPHNVAHASFILQSSLQHFPRRSAFLCVVDPGVGTARKLLLARNDGRFFLAPDNGLLSFLCDLDTDWWVLHKPHAPHSSTFHGRDILAPAAARLAGGKLPEDLGVRCDPRHIEHVSSPPPLVDSDHLSCTVLHVDRFGNCLLDLPPQSLPDSHAAWTLNGRTVTPVKTYADLQPGRIGLLVGSQGVMELTMNQAALAQELRLTPGDAVTLARVRTT